LKPTHNCARTNQTPEFRKDSGSVRDSSGVRFTSVLICTCADSRGDCLLWPVLHLAQQTFIVVPDHCVSGCSWPGVCPQMDTTPSRKGRARTKHWCFYRVARLCRLYAVSGYCPPGALTCSLVFVEHGQVIEHRGCSGMPDTRLCLREARRLLREEHGVFTRVPDCRRAWPGWSGSWRSPGARSPADARAASSPV